MQYSESVALRQQLAVLRENLTQLGGQLSQAARQLQDAGTPPNANLTDDLAASRSAFSGLCEEILSMAETLAVSPPPTRGEMTSLSKLDGLLKVVAEAEEKKGAVEQTRVEALRIVEQVLSITHSENAAFRPLLECQATARELHQTLSTITWPNTHPDMQTLAAGKHPLASLLSLVNSVAELDDEKWGVCQDVVEQAFGKPLAVAALRGRLGCSRQKKEADVPVAPVSSAPQAGQNAESTAGVQPHPPAAGGTSGANGASGTNLESPATAATRSAQPVAQAVKSSPATKSSPLKSPTAKTQKGEPTPPVQPMPSAQPVQHAPAGAPVQQVTNAMSQRVEPPSGNAQQPASLLSALNALETLDTQTSSSVTNGPAHVLNQAAQKASNQAARQAPHHVSTQTAQTHKKEASPSADTAPAEGSAQARAALILSGKPEERPTALRDLIYQLLLEDKLSLAFHMTLSGRPVPRYPTASAGVAAAVYRAGSIRAGCKREPGSIAERRFRPLEPERGWECG